MSTTRLQPESPASVERGPADPTDAPVFGTQLLTVNVEDYFQTGAFRQFISHETWYRFETRLRRNIETVLELLNEHETTATFFVLGWIAEKHPALVRMISDAGHEVASRGYLHQRLVAMPPEEVRRDLIRSQKLLEDATGQPVTGFRLSDGWLQSNDLWLLDELAGAGYLYDSSVLPQRRRFARDPAWRTIRTIETRNGQITEIPLSTANVGGWMPIAGGNYLRQMPDRIMRRLVDHFIRNEDQPYVMYFHAWELDPAQPRLSVAGRMTQLRHYRNLDKFGWLLPQYLSRHDFASIRDYSQLRDRHLAHLAGASPKSLPFAAVTPQSAQHMTDDSPQDDTAVAVLAPASTTTDTATEITPVTVVIPCLNEEGSLPYLANTLETVRDRLAQHRFDMSIIFVDDGSTDTTCELLEELFGRDDSVRIIRHEHNKGVSGAIFTGLKAADTDIVCSMDCDCSYDPHELAVMLDRMTDDTELVTASPYHREGIVRNVPGWRLVLSKGLSAMYCRLLNSQLATWTSCFRVYRRSRVLRLPMREHGFLGTAELAALLVLSGGHVKEHPATLETRLFGVSKMKTLKTILRHLRLYVRIARLRLFGQTADERAFAEISTEPATSAKGSTR